MYSFEAPQQTTRVSRKSYYFLLEGETGSLINFNQIEEVKVRLGMFGDNCELLLFVPLLVAPKWFALKVWFNILLEQGLVAGARWHNI